MLNSGYTKAPAMVSTAGAAAEDIKRPYCKSGVTLEKESNTFHLFTQSLLTSGRRAGKVSPELQNSSTKARRSLDAGIFYCVYALEKHSVFTAIFCRVWDNTIPLGGIFPPFVDGFEHAAFFALFELVTALKTQKFYEVKSCLN